MDCAPDPSADRVRQILEQVKRLAREYRSLTGKPLGVTGEIAEYEAARLLALTLTPARTAGHDATRIRNGTSERIQIKGRVIFEGAAGSQRIGTIKRDAACDTVMLVLLDETLSATEILAAPYSHVIAALDRPGSTAAARGQMAVSTFRHLAETVWIHPTNPAHAPDTA